MYRHTVLTFSTQFDVEGEVVDVFFALTPHFKGNYTGLSVIDGKEVWYDVPVMVKGEQGSYAKHLVDCPDYDSVTEISDWGVSESDIEETKDMVRKLLDISKPF